MFLENINFIKNEFSHCTSTESKYQKLIELGRKLPPLDESLKKDHLIVPGCQSIVYLHSYADGGKIFFQVGSDALISSGLAYLLVTVYSGETAETIIKSPPTFIEEMGIFASLSPGRSNGLASMYLRMKKDSINFLMIETANQGRSSCHA